MYKTILIDDEKLATSRLERLLEKYKDIIQLIGNANNGAEGLLMIETLKPDLIFLDIEMPVMNGFELLAQLSYMPLVVFATAFDEYAIKAFEENSIDYLLKPIEAERLEKTIEKLSRIQPSAPKPALNEQLLALLEKIKPKKVMTSISAKVGNKIVLIGFEEISHFEADDKYVFLFTLAGQKYLISYTISTLAEKLPDHFKQISRGCIVNIQQIKEYEKHFNGKFVVTMRDKNASKVQTGSTFQEVLKNLFEL